MIAMLLGLFLPGWAWAWAGGTPEGSLMLYSWPLAGLVLGTWGWQAHATLRHSLELHCENRRLRRESELRRQAAERDDRAKSRFLAVASHDLRQPLQGLLLQVEALRLLSAADQRYATLVERIGRSSGALARLLNSLLDLSRLDLQQDKASSRPIELGSLLADLGATYAARAAQQGIGFRSRLGPRCAIESDGVRLRRILDNLLDNALRNTERGGVLLAARRRRDEVWIEVWDTGCGIAEPEQALVFDEFYRARKATAAGEAGLGLGLAVAKRLAASLQARLQLRSRPGRGSVFRLQLLAATGLPKSPAAQVELESKADAAKPLWVLLLERDDERRDEWQALLSHWGCQVLASSDVAQALKLSERSTQVPALILIGQQARLESASDLVDCVERLRDEYNSTLPCIVLSAEADPAAAQAYADADCRLAILPIEIDAMRTLLGAALGNALPIQSAPTRASPAAERA
jgi:signal transduction histidine kinase/CheY-like chemotaxis protein